MTAAMGRTIEQQLSELYLANLDVIGDGFPVAVNAARSEYLESFMLRGLPTVRDERYRHTDVRGLFSGEWEYYFSPQPVPQGGSALPECDGYRIEVANGFCKGGVTELDNGVIYGSLRAAMEGFPELVSAYYNRVADNDGEAVTALNSVFMQDGAFVYIPDNVDAEKPFVLDFAYGSGGEDRLCFARALIVAGRNSRADVLLSHRTAGDAPVLVDFVRETVTEQDAILNINEISLVNDRSSIISGSYMRQDTGSHTRAMNLWFGGGMTRVNSVTDLTGRGCESELRGLFFGTGEQRTDITMDVNHLVPDCQSSELVKGVVSGNAVGAFTGRVLVAKDAQRTLAMQQSRNIQLSETARIYAEPQLEIYADDVKCSHGATVGQIDDDMILYMRQRGISEADAKRLRLYGFVNDVVSGCTVESSCGWIEQMATECINEL